MFLAKAFPTKNGFLAAGETSHCPPIFRSSISLIFIFTLFLRPFKIKFEMVLIYSCASTPDLSKG